jgi:hypothetical protein
MCNELRRVLVPCLETLDTLTAKNSAVPHEMTGQSAGSNLSINGQCSKWRMYLLTNRV